MKESRPILQAFCVRLEEMTEMMSLRFRKGAAEYRTC